MLNKDAKTALIMRAKFYDKNKGGDANNSSIESNSQVINSSVDSGQLRNQAKPSMLPEYIKGSKKNLLEPSMIGGSNSKRSHKHNNQDLASVSIIVPPINSAGSRQRTPKKSQKSSQVNSEHNRSP